MKLIFLFTLLAFNHAKAQNADPAGKTYKAQTGAACKEMTGGGCMIYTYCVLKFKKDSVQVSYPVKAACTPGEREKTYEHMYDHLVKTYTWNASGETLQINGFSEYGTLIMKNARLAWNEKLEFTEVTGIDP